MTDTKSDGKEAEASRAGLPWISRGILTTLCALVIAVYAFTTNSGYFVARSLNPADTYYNLLVQGFRAGQLNLKFDVPPGLAKLPDPYDPAAHAPYPVLDMSYYKGKLYLYFGVMPAVVLFWPYVALTGHYLPQTHAAVIFCLVGFLVSVGLLYALWRRYFANVSVAVVAASTVALGLVTFMQPLLARCDIHEVAISCGYAFSMVALAGIWKALHEPRRQCLWLVAASLAYGLAVGARPSLLFGAAILLIPVAQAWRERRKLWAPLLAAAGPIALIGLGLMLYNAARFDSPFEFGTRYQLTVHRQLNRQFFSLRYLWVNLRVYFLEPARWSRRFPFVHDIHVSPLPLGYYRVEPAFGVLADLPLVWLALVLPSAWRNRADNAGSVLSRFAMAVALLFGVSALTICLFYCSSVRYEAEFLPALVLLAVMGILGLERALADLPVWRRAVRAGWGLLLGFSVAFNLFASVERCAQADYNQGVALHQAGRVPEALRHFEQAVRLNPDFAEAHFNLGVTLGEAGRMKDAMAEYEEAVRLNPDFAEAHFNLGVALEQAGEIQEAIEHYGQALQVDPDFAEAHFNLGVILAGQHRLQKAISHYEQALRIKPDFAEAHYNLAETLMQLGQPQDAIGHYEQALRVRPDYAEAHNSLGVAQARVGNLDSAIGHYEQALRIKPDYAEAHYNLGVALVRLGRAQDAISHWEQALRIKPDFLQAQQNLARARAAQ